MRRLLLACTIATLSSTLALAADARPRIRAVTAFIEINRSNYADQVVDAQKFLATSKEALNKAGFDGAAGRITTNPFPVWTKGLSRDEAVSLVKNLREAAAKGRSGLNIGPAMINDD